MYRSSKSQAPQRHLNSYIHSIIQHTKQFPHPTTFTEIKDALAINLYNSPAILHALKNNSKLIVNNNTIQFKPKYTIKNKDDIKALLNATENNYGIEMVELVDCPVDIKGFVKELVADNLVFLVKDLDGSEILFNNDMQIDAVVPEVKERWTQIRVPDYEEVRASLKVAGMKSGYNEVRKIRNIELVAKDNKPRKKMRITNTHIKGL